MSFHLKPLYMITTFNGVPVKRVLVDNCVALKIIPLTLIKKIGCNKANMIPSKVVISFFIFYFFWGGGYKLSYEFYKWI